VHPFLTKIFPVRFSTDSRNVIIWELSEVVSMNLEVFLIIGTIVACGISAEETSAAVRRTELV
jgi:hypothetical protein